MTAFNFLLEENRVCIGMDTLMISADTKAPFKYISKIFLLPHLNGVVCGTGFAEFILNWYLLIQSSIIAKDIDHLDLFASEALRKIAKNFTNEFSATIYHFGWSDQQKRFIGLVYRSTNDFISESLPYGLGTKPQIHVDKLNELPGDFVRIIEKQKRQDEASQNQSKVGIGGDIHFLLMTQEGYSLSRCHRFDDYDAAYDQMIANLI